MDEETLRKVWESTVSPAAAWDRLPTDETYRPPTVKAGPSRTPRSHPAPPGAAASSFDLIGEIGRGGMGIVFRATQRTLDREVAVKQNRPESDDDEARRQFVAEALVTGMLDHPNIVPVHDLGRTPDGRIYLAMKLVSGIPWRALLDPRTPDEKARAAGADLARHLGILLNVCNAVAYAHSKGIVHRDLKPENVMLGEFGEVLVMDWGLAVDVRDGSAPGAKTRHKSEVDCPAGTPCYMPPELAEGRGDRLGPWTDVYLLGSILHEIVTGNPPHRGRTLMAVLQSASRSDPPVFPAGAPLELESVCRRAMARDPRDRFQTVPEFQKAIQDHLQHRESTLIAAAAEGALGRACAPRPAGGDVHRVYADFAEAAAGFRQARVLWRENAAAVEGERRARRAYAEAALAAHDLALAAAQAAELDDPGLKARIAQAQAARDRSARTARLLRRGLIAAAVLIVTGLAVGLWAVRSEQLRTERARKDEARQRALAERREREARFEACRARVEAARGLYERSFALQKEGRLQAAAAALLRALEMAPRNLVPEGYPAAPGNPGWAEEAWIRYRYLEAQLDRPHARFAGHAGTVETLALSPDGKFLLSQAGADPFRLWDVESGKPGRELEGAGEGGGVAAAQFGSRDGTLRGLTRGCEWLTWDATSGRILARRLLPVPGGAPLKAAVSPEADRCIVLDTGRRVCCVDAREGGKGFAFEVLDQGSDPGVAISAGGTRGAAWNGRTIFVWDLALGTEVRRFADISDVVVQVALSPNGEELAACCWGGTARFWRLKDGTESGRIDGEGTSVSDLVYSPDGRFIWITGGGLPVRVLDAATKETVRVLEAFDPGVYRVALSAGGRFAAGAKGNHALRVWEIGGSPAVRLPSPASPVISLAAGPADGASFGGCTSGTVFEWPAGGGGGPVLELGHPVDGLLVSPDGSRFVTSTADGLVRVWHRPGKDWAELSRFQDESSKRDPSLRGAIRALTRSEDGTRIFGPSDWDGAIVVFDAATLKPIARLPGDRQYVAALASDSGGRIVVSATEEGAVRILDVAAGREMRRFDKHTGWVHAVAVSPDGRLALSASEDKTARVWEIATAVERWRLPHATPVYAAAFDRGGRIAVTGCEDHTVRVWDIGTGRELARLDWPVQESPARWDKRPQFHHRRDELNALALAPGGEAVLTAGGVCVTRQSLLDPRTPEDPPAVHPDRPDPYREFEAFYRIAGVRVVREGPRLGTIEPLPPPLDRDQAGEW